MNWKDLPSLTSLRAFEAAARCLSFTAAGNELNVTHGAVIQQVRRLEEHLDIKLIKSSGPKLYLTNEGEKYAEAIRKSFIVISNATNNLSDDSNESNLRITATPSFAHLWLWPNYSEFRKLLPKINITILPTVKTLDLSSGECDIAIRFGTGQWEGYESDLLITTDAIVACSPSIIKNNQSANLDSIQHLPWLQETGSEELRALSNQLTNYSITHLPGSMLVDAMVKGHGVAITSRFLVEREIERGSLKVLHTFDAPKGIAGYYFVKPANLQSNAISIFREWIITRFQQMPQSKPEQAISDAIKKVA